MARPNQSPLPNINTSAANHKPVQSTPTTTPRRRYRKPSQPATPHQPHSSVFSPRPIEHLRTERYYLQESLAAQGRHVATILFHLAQAEENAGVETQPPDQRRKFRKRASLLRNEIASAEAQEKAILVRLGELCAEMQSRERWAHVQMMRLEAGMNFDSATLGFGCYPALSPMSTVSPMTPMTPMSTMTPAGAMGLNMAPLNMDPATPAFHPAFMNYNPWAVLESPVSSTEQNMAPTTSPGRRSADLGTLPTVEEEAISPTNKTEFPAVPQRLEWVGRSLSLPVVLYPRPRDKRMSVPALRSVWPDN